MCPARVRGVDQRHILPGAPAQGRRAQEDGIPELVYRRALSRSPRRIYGRTSFLRRVRSTFDRSRSQDTPQRRCGFILGSKQLASALHWVPQPQDGSRRRRVWKCQARRRGSLAVRLPLVTLAYVAVRFEALPCLARCYCLLVVVSDDCCLAGPAWLDADPPPWGRRPRGGGQGGGPAAPPKINK